MFNLVVAVMSIVLVGMSLLATIQYTNPLLPAEKQAERLIATGFSSLASGWDAYRIQNQTFEWECETFSTPINDYEDCFRQIDNPGHLPVSGWKAQLVPEYIFEPRPPANTAWVYNINSNGIYFCLSGSFSRAQLVGAFRASSAFAIDSFAVADNCGSINGYELSDVDEGSYAITYWVQRTL